MQDDGITVRQVVGDYLQNRPVDSAMEAQAVRWSLRELARRAPGRSVEVRVPPHGAVQAIAGTRHRRGTPSAVVQADGRTWLLLVTGHLDWPDAIASGRVQASGERSDLSEYLPLMNVG
ncbi:MAG: sterol carrier family protein [Actinomycetales bacterium]